MWPKSKRRSHGVRHWTINESLLFHCGVTLSHWLPSLWTGLDTTAFTCHYGVCKRPPGDLHRWSRRSNVVAPTCTLEAHGLELPSPPPSPPLHPLPPPSIRSRGRGRGPGEGDSPAAFSISPWQGLLFFLSCLLGSSSSLFFLQKGRKTNLEHTQLTCHRRWLAQRLALAPWQLKGAGWASPSSQPQEEGKGGRRRDAYLLGAWEGGGHSSPPAPPPQGTPGLSPTASCPGLHYTPSTSSSHWMLKEASHPKEGKVCVREIHAAAWMEAEAGKGRERFPPWAQDNRPAVWEELGVFPPDLRSPYRSFTGFSVWGWGGLMFFGGGVCVKMLAVLQTQPQPHRLTRRATHSRGPVITTGWNRKLKKYVNNAHF